MIIADKTRIGQVISNLISNAAKFISENGSISIKLRNDADHDGFITVIVRDSGTGIHPSVMSRLFTKFATMPGTSTGTGLGLFISKSIIEAHGGRMWAENNRDKGAAFYFSLPSKVGWLIDWLIGWWATLDFCFSNTVQESNQQLNTNNNFYYNSKTQTDSFKKWLG